MSVPSESPTPESLDRLWEQWKVVIDLFARRNMTRHQLRLDVYRALHRKLLEACDRNTEERYETTVQMVAEVVRPWTSLDSLNDAPPKILSDLWASCQAVDRQLYGLRGARKSGSRTSVVIFVALSVLVFVVTLTVLVFDAGSGVSGVLLDLWKAGQSFQVAIEGRFRAWFMGGVGLALAALMAYFAMQSTRKP